MAADGRCYLVLEMAAETLEEYWKRVPHPLAPSEVQRVFREICEATAALHASGYVHMDLKPANLMRFPASGRFKCAA